MFKSGRPPIALVIASPKGSGDPNHQDPDNDAGDDMDDPGDIALDKAGDHGDAPSVYLENVKGLPGFLDTGFEGEVTFRARVTERATNPDGTVSLGLSLLEMEPPTQPRGTSGAARGHDAVSRNFAAAMEDHDQD